MYNSFFRLRESPFNVNVDPRFFIPTQQTAQALQRIAYGLQNRKGLILLTGEVGTGKTMMINQLLDWLRQMGTPTAFVFNSKLGEGDLFNLMARDFGITTEPDDRANLPIRLNRWLLECFRAGLSPVLIVDEAQGLSFERLEEIRLLLNIETPSDKMLQIVFAGQPELEDNLNQPQGRQIRQRIAVRCKIGSLTLQQTHDYIERRLRIAGASGESIFQSEAMDAVYFYSRGIPRVINLVCEHSLINAYVDQLRPVPAHVVEGVAGEFQLTSSPATANPAPVQPTRGWMPTSSAPAYEPAEAQRAHAAAAGGSSRFPKPSPNTQPAPAFSDLQAHSAAPSISEASPLANTPFAPPPASAPAEPLRHWPVVSPAPTHAPPVRRIVTAVMPPPSRPFAPTLRDENRPGAEIPSVERSPRQRRWVSRPHPTKTFRRWCSNCRDRFLSFFAALIKGLFALPILRWLTTPREHLQPASRIRQNVQPRPQPKPAAPPQPNSNLPRQDVQPRPASAPSQPQSSSLRQDVYPRPASPPPPAHSGMLSRVEKSAAHIAQAARHQRSAIFRWLQQPLSHTHRR